MNNKYTLSDVFSIRLHSERRSPVQFLVLIPLKVPRISVFYNMALSVV